MCDCVDKSPVIPVWKALALVDTSLSGEFAVLLFDVDYALCLGPKSGLAPGLVLGSVGIPTVQTILTEMISGTHSARLNSQTLSNYNSSQ